MKIAIAGGGPAGLYLGYLLKRDHSGHSVDIFEQNPQGNTWGFGVVFSDRALDFLNIDDPETCLLYTSPSPRDQLTSRMPSSA